MAQRWWTVEEIAARYGLKPSYVYRLASIRQWPRRRDHDRRVRYCPENVAATLAPGQRRTCPRAPEQHPGAGGETGTAGPDEDGTRTG